jgi:hypothetical protein
MKLATKKNTASTKRPMPTTIAICIENPLAGTTRVARPSGRDAKRLIPPSHDMM